MSRWSDPEGFFSDMERTLDSFFGNSASVRGVEVYEQEGKLFVSLEAPGVDPSKIEIRVFKDRVSVRSAEEGEDKEEDKTFYCRRCARKLSYEIALPYEIDTDQANAAIRNGMVLVSAPKAGSQAGKILKLEAE
jgi:HSP20 family protein